LPPSHRVAVRRLTLVSLLFIGWLGYLVYLVLHLPPSGPSGPIVLSRPQFLVSHVDVIARIDGKDGPVRVEEVRSRIDDEFLDLQGKDIKVTNLSQCRAQDGDKALDWTGPGRYLVPLFKIEGDSFSVVPIPPSPGYPANHPGSAGPPRIYPANPKVMEQYAALQQQRH
jgi:hypothetical protein